jgi:hypothetical protein
MADSDNPDGPVANPWVEEVLIRLRGEVWRRRVYARDSREWAEKQDEVADRFLALIDRLESGAPVHVPEVVGLCLDLHRTMDRLQSPGFMSGLKSLADGGVPDWFPPEAGKC